MAAIGISFALQGLGALLSSFKSIGQGLMGLKGKSEGMAKSISLISNLANIVTGAVAAFFALQQVMDLVANGLKMLVGAGAKLAKWVVGTGMMFDGFRAKLRALYKDTEKAGVVMQKALDIAAKTPFVVEDVVDAVASFKAVGLDPEQIIGGRDLITDMGDLAFALDKTLKDIQFSVKEAAAEQSWISFRRRLSITKNQIVATLKSAGENVDFSTPMKTLESLRKFIHIQFGGTMEQMERTVKVRMTNIRDQFTQFADKIYTSGIDDALATVFGDVLDRIVALFKGDAGTKIAESIGTIFQFLATQARSAIPIIEELIKYTIDGFKRLVDFIQKASKTTILATWIENFKMTWTIIYAIIKGLALFANGVKTLIMLIEYIPTLLESSNQQIGKASKNAITIISWAGRGLQVIFFIMRKIVEAVIEAQKQAAKLFTGIQSLTKTGKWSTRTAFSAMSGDAQDISKTFTDIIRQSKDDSGFLNLNKLMKSLKDHTNDFDSAMGDIADKAVTMGYLTASETNEYRELSKLAFQIGEALNDTTDKVIKAKEAWFKIKATQDALKESVNSMVDNLRVAMGLITEREAKMKRVKRLEEEIAGAKRIGDLERESKLRQEQVSSLTEMVARMREIEEALHLNAGLSSQQEGALAASMGIDKFVELKKEYRELQRITGASNTKELAGTTGEKIKQAAIVQKKLFEKAKGEAFDAKKLVEETTEAITAMTTGYAEATRALGEWIEAHQDRFPVELLKDYQAEIDSLTAKMQRLAGIGVINPIAEGIQATSKQQAASIEQFKSRNPTPDIPDLPSEANRDTGSTYYRNPLSAMLFGALAEPVKATADSTRAMAESLREISRDQRNPVSPSKSDGLSANIRPLSGGAH